MKVLSLILVVTMFAMGCATTQPVSYPSPYTNQILPPDLEKARVDRLRMEAGLPVQAQEESWTAQEIVLGIIFSPVIIAALGLAAVATIASSGYHTGFTCNSRTYADGNRTTTSCF